MAQAGSARVKGTLLFGAQLIAFYPAVHWYAVRSRYASEGRWELVALVAAVLLVFAKRVREPRSLKLPVILTLAWIVSWYCLPPLISTWVAWTALAATASALFLGRALDPHLFCFATLSLPVLPLFQYHLSFPLRSVVAQLSALLLRFTGMPVIHEGACLALDERLIWVDAPCSGLRMMWSALFLAVCLAAMHRHRAGRTAVILVATVVTVIAANVLRTTSLFFIEAELLSAPAWFHPAAGLAVYGLTALALLLVVRTGKELHVRSA